MLPSLSTAGPRVRSAHTRVHMQDVSVTVAACVSPVVSAPRADGIGCVPQAGAGLCVHCEFRWLRKAAFKPIFHFTAC